MAGKEPVPCLSKERGRNRKYYLCVIFSSVVYIFLRGCRHDDAQTNTVNAAGPRRDLAASWHETVDGGGARSAVPRLPANHLQSPGAGAQTRICTAQIAQHAVFAGPLWDQTPGQGGTGARTPAKTGGAAL